MAWLQPPSFIAAFTLSQVNAYPTGFWVLANMVLFQTVFWEMLAELLHCYKVVLGFAYFYCYKPLGVHEAILLAKSYQTCSLSYQSWNATRTSVMPFSSARAR